MIRKKWNGDELVLSVETEDEFWKAVSTGEAVELTRELGDQIGLMEDETDYRGRGGSREERSERLGTEGPRSSLKPRGGLYFIRYPSTGNRYTKI